MNMIVAMTLDNGIGRDNDLLCYLKSDLQYFKHQTLDSIVVMGRKTFESLPSGPLKDRVNIVMTRREEYSHQGIVVKNNKSAVLEYIKRIHPDKKVFIIGGSSIYEQFLDEVEKLYITYYLTHYEADTHFPEFQDKFKLVELKHDHKHLIEEEKEEKPHVYAVYERIK